MKSLASLSLMFAVSLASLPALADALPPAPCEGKTQGAACIDMNNKSGVCQPGDGCTYTPCLVCDTTGSSSSSSSSGATSSSSSSSSSSGAPAEDEGGCAMSPGRGTSLAVVAATLGLLGFGAMRRRRRR